MVKTVKNSWRHLRNGRPGTRFIDFCHYRRKKCGDKFCWSRFFTMFLGFALFVFGLAIGWLPGPGGFLAIVGLAIMAQEFPFIAKLLDQGEILLRYLWRWFWRIPRQTKFALGGLALLATAVVGFLALGLWTGSL